MRYTLSLMDQRTTSSEPCSLSEGSDELRDERAPHTYSLTSWASFHIPQPARHFHLLYPATLTGSRPLVPSILAPPADVDQASILRTLAGPRPLAATAWLCCIDTMDLHGDGAFVAGDWMGLEALGWRVTSKLVPGRRARGGRPAQASFTMYRAWNKALGLSVRGSPWSVRVSITSVAKALRGRGDRLDGITEGDVAGLLEQVVHWLPLTTEGLKRRGGWQVARIDVCRDVDADFDALRSVYRYARSSRFRRFQSKKYMGYMRWGTLGGACLKLYDQGLKLMTSGHLGDDVPAVGKRVRIELGVRHPGRRAWFSSCLTPASEALPGELVVSLFVGRGKPPVRVALRFEDLHRVLRRELAVIEGDESVDVAGMNRDRRRRVLQVVDGVDDGEAVLRGEKAVKWLWRDPAARGANRNAALQVAKQRAGIRLMSLAYPAGDGCGSPGQVQAVRTVCSRAPSAPHEKEEGHGEEPNTGSTTAAREGEQEAHLRAPMGGVREVPARPAREAGRDRGPVRDPSQRSGLRCRRDHALEGVDWLHSAY